jgi:hypothetical protein
MADEPVAMPVGIRIIAALPLRWIVLCVAAILIYFAAGIIFCGSVVRDDFEFDKVLDRFEVPLLNEVGTRDFLPALGESAGWGSLFVTGRCQTPDRPWVGLAPTGKRRLLTEHAKSRLMHRSKQHLYSITSSGRANGDGGLVRPASSALSSPTYDEAEYRSH